MKNLKNHIQGAFFLVTLISFTCCSTSKSEKLTIATAANMQFAMQELIKAFENKTDIECETIVSSSGKLTAQIKEGAPFDIFVSADMKFPTELYKLGLTIDKPKVYAKGKLILWSLIDTIQPNFKILSSKNIKHIAVANPKTAPYGVAANEVLKKENLLNQIEKKLVYGESVAQTNQFITTKAAEIGFTAMSVAVSPKMKGKGNYIPINESLYSPIYQGIVLIKNKRSNNSNKQKFYNFLFSMEGRNILTKFGYSVQD